MSEFSVGDLVYVPNHSTEVLTLSKNGGSHKFPLCIKGTDLTFTTEGKLTTYDVLPSVFHANPHNREAIKLLYGLDMQTHSISNQVQKLLDTPNCIGVACYLSDYDTNPSTEIGLVTRVDSCGTFETLNAGYEFATIIKPVYHEHS